jgi:hypothetical protein
MGDIFNHFFFRKKKIFANFYKKNFFINYFSLFKKLAKMSKFVSRNVIILLPNGEPVWSTCQITTGEERATLQSMYQVEELGSSDVVFQNIPIGKLYYIQKPDVQSSKNPLGSKLLGSAVHRNCYLLSDYKKSETPALTKDMFEKLKAEYCSLTGKTMKKQSDEKAPNRAKTALDFFTTEHVATQKKLATEQGKTVVVLELKEEAKLKWEEVQNKDKYFELEAKDKVRYEQAFAEYVHNNPKPPKPAKSAYQSFCKKTGHLPGKRREEDMSLPNWTTLTEEEKREYEEDAAKDKPRFDREYAEYEAKCHAIGKNPEDYAKPKKTHNSESAAEMYKQVLLKNGIEVPEVTETRKRRKTGGVAKPASKPTAKAVAAPKIATHAAEQIANESSDDSESD